MPDTQDKSGLRPPSRRDFLRGAAIGALVAGAGCETHAQSHDGVATDPIVHGTVTALLKVNGQNVEVLVEPRTTLLDALRDGLKPDGKAVDLTGAKRVCDRGTCGSCTVLLDGKPVYACSLLALDAMGHEIRTVEGLAEGDTLHAVQQAFVDHDGLMCGFCTPGFIMSAVALLESNPKPTPEQIRAGLNGNLCRCGTYARIFEAVADAAGKMQRGG